MNKLAEIITTLSLLKEGPKLSIDEKAAVRVAIVILGDAERLGITVEAESKDYYYTTHRGKTRR
jgi:hypothetical protein